MDWVHQKISKILILLSTNQTKGEHYPTTLRREETIMTTNEESDPSVFASVAASDSFSRAVGEFLALADLAQLMSVCKDCHRALHSWLPKEALALVNTTLPSQVLVFGVHGCCKLNDNGIYRSPTPIIRFAFDSLGFDTKTCKLTGQPWSEVACQNNPPISLGRINPNVCPANEKGSKIFYCGGRLSVANAETRWLGPNDMSKGPSSVVAIFDVDTSTWRRLPPMPIGTSNSGI